METTKYSKLLDNIHAHLADAETCVILIGHKDRAFTALIEGNVKDIAQLLSKTTVLQPNLSKAIKLHMDFVAWKGEGRDSKISQLATRIEDATTAFCLVGKNKPDGDMDMSRVIFGEDVEMSILVAKALQDYPSLLKMLEVAISYYKENGKENIS